MIVGEGPLEHKLKAEAEALGITNIHFLGRVSDERLRTLYSACEVFVLPSVSDTECFGLVQVEAMLAEKPVINTSLPTGVSWVSIHEQTGLTVPPGDPQALRAALDKLLSDPVLAKELGRQGKARALEYFSLEKHARAVASLYEKTLVQNQV